MVGQEHDPAAGQHGAADLPGQAGEDAGEGGGRTVPHPQPSRRAAAVALPMRRFVLRAGQQDRHRAAGRDVAGRPELQPPRWRAVDRDGVRPGQERGGLPGRADREDLAVGVPAGDAGPAVSPPGEPAVAGAVGAGHVDFAGGIARGRPGHRGTVRGQPRAAHRRAFGGQPPGAAAGSRRQPDVVVGDERQQVTLNVRIAKITDGSHRSMVWPPDGVGPVRAAQPGVGRSQPGAGGRSQPRGGRRVTAPGGRTPRRAAGHSQPRSSAMCRASLRLRAPVFWMQADR